MADEFRKHFAAERGEELIGRFVAKRFDNENGKDSETGDFKGQLFIGKIISYNEGKKEYTVQYPSDGAKERFGDEDVDDMLLPLGIAYECGEDSDNGTPPKQSKKRGASNPSSQKSAKRARTSDKAAAAAADDDDAEDEEEEAEEEDMDFYDGGAHGDAADSDADDGADDDDPPAPASGRASGRLSAQAKGKGPAAPKPSSGKASGSGKASAGGKKKSAGGAGGAATPKASAKKGKKKSGTSAAGRLDPDKYLPSANSPDEEITYTNKDTFLWGARAAKLPNPLPKTLRVLELFAGCGGTHMEGTAKYKGLSVRIETVCAVELEKAPADSYASNHKEVRVLNMGIARFLATSRRLAKLKAEGAGAGKNGGEGAEGIKVTDVSVDPSVVHKPRLPLSQLNPEDKNGKKGKKSNDNQYMDYTLLPEIKGERALPWVRWVVQRPGEDDTDYVHDTDLSAAELVAVRAYLNGPTFHRGVFPLPGDIDKITGGPPCQGFSGYNVQRPMGKELEEIFAHAENQLILRFLECVFWFRPLYVVMEEVPTVGKPAIMGTIKAWIEDKGYSLEFNKAIRTGLHGCPQTRDRLLVFLTMNGLAMPPFPTPITRSPASKPDCDEIPFAFKQNQSAYPLRMMYLADGRIAANGGASTSSGSGGAAAKGTGKGKATAAAAACAADDAEDDSAEGAEGSDDDGANAAAAKKAGKRPAEDAKSQLEIPERDRSLMRGLVVGDCLSCDLPISATQVTTGKKDLHTLLTEYECAPPTPYLAYLRKDMPKGAKVANHIVFDIGPLDTIRVAHVPMREGSSWRDMAGPNGVITRPMGIELTEAEWKSISRRWVNKIPKDLLAPEEGDEGEGSNAAAGKGKGKGKGKADDAAAEGAGKAPAKGKKLAAGAAAEIPKLKEGIVIRRNIAPLVPYWCLTKGHMRDHACYGRLRYTDASDTIHSYFKPHWHRMLPPFSMRVCSVRDKARGFPDTFVFRGTIQQQYKQVANAVSPQLAKAIGRCVLATLLAAHGAAEPEKAEFGGGLLNFADFLARFDEKTLPKVNRFKPEVDGPNRRELKEMTYGEILTEYNTLSRTDHSKRFEKYTPFEVLEMAEDYREWCPEEIIAIRLKEDVGLQPPPGSRLHPHCLEYLCAYPGFPHPEWVDHAGVSSLWQYREFLQSAPEGIREVTHGLVRSFVLPGRGAGLALEDYSPSVFVAKESAKIDLKEMADRYKRDFPGKVEAARKLRMKEEAAAELKKASKRKPKAAAGGGGGEEAEEDAEEGEGEEAEDDDAEEDEEEEEEEEGE